MKKFRLSALFLLLTLLVVVPAVFAQDTLGASQGDYDLWTSANAGLATVNTFSYDFTAKLNVTGMSDPSENVTADLKGSGVLDKTDMSKPAFQLDVTGTLTQGTDKTDVNAGVRIVDGNIYYTTDGTTWQGSSLSDAESQAGSMFSQGLATGSGDTSATPDMSSLASSPQAQQMMSALQNLKPSDFLTLTRTDENGQAHFNLNIDIAKLLSSPGFQSMMTSMTSAAGASTEDASSAQQMMMMGQMLFSTAKINLDQYVDPNTKLVSRTVLDVNVPLDQMMGAGAGVTANFDINMTNYNQPVTVTAPANATMMDSSSS